MGKIHGYYEWDETIGDPGHRDDGSLHQNLYNEDRVLAGHARFVPDDERLDEENEYSYENTFVTSEYRRDSEGTDELAKTIALALTALTMAGIAAAPHVKKWWKERALPAVSRQSQKVRNIGSKKEADEPEAEVLEPVQDEHTTVEVDRRQIMSREEAISRVIAGLAARAYSDEQLRMVRSARIVGVGDYAEIEQMIAQIPPERLQVLISKMVKNPALLEDGSLANLASMLKSSSQLPELISEPINREELEP